MPKAPRIRKGYGHTEAKSIAMEMAAMAWVRMENDEYIFPSSARRVVGGVNKAEIMRIAGYSPKSVKSFDTTLGKKPEFWRLVELYRMRRNDPMFRKEAEHLLMGKIAGNLAKILYERSEYYPHSISFRDAVAALKAVAELGFKADELGNTSRVEDLLSKLTPEQRATALAGIEGNLNERLKKLQSLRLAHEAADAEAEQ